MRIYEKDHKRRINSFESNNRSSKLRSISASLALVFVAAVFAWAYLGFLGYLPQGVAP